MQQLLYPTSPSLSTHYLLWLNHSNMKLGRDLKYNGVEYKCTFDERYFNNESALYDRCRQTSRHAWCERCSRVFLLTAAKETHLRESSAHSICSICPQAPGFKTNEDLNEHLVETHHLCPDRASRA